MDFCRLIPQTLAADFGEISGSLNPSLHTKNGDDLLSNPLFHVAFEGETVADPSPHFRVDSFSRVVLFHFQQHNVTCVADVPRMGQAPSSPPTLCTACVSPVKLVLRCVGGLVRPASSLVWAASLFPGAVCVCPELLPSSSLAVCGSLAALRYDLSLLCGGPHPLQRPASWGRSAGRRLQEGARRRAGLIRTRVKEQREFSPDPVLTLAMTEHACRGHRSGHLQDIG